MESRHLLDDQAPHDDSILAKYRRLQTLNAEANDRVTQSNRAKDAFSAQDEEDLYQYFIAEISNTITMLEDNECPYIDEARKFLDQIKAMHDSRWQRYEPSCIPQAQLNEMLDATHSLLTTPMQQQDQSLNPEFVLCQETFSGKIAELNQLSNTKISSGFFHAAIALTCAIGAAALIALTCVMSLGLAAFLTVPAATFLTGMAIVETRNAIGFFSPAYKAHQTCKQGNALTAAMVSERDNRPGIH